MISLYRLASENCITPKILETIAINNTVVSAYYLNKETVTIKDAVKKNQVLIVLPHSFFTFISVTVTRACNWSLNETILECT